MIILRRCLTLTVSSLTRSRNIREFWAAMGREFELPDANFAAAVKGQTLTYIFDTYFPEVSQQGFFCVND